MQGNSAAELECIAHFESGDICGREIKNRRVVELAEDHQVLAESAAEQVPRELGAHGFVIVGVYPKPSAGTTGKNDARISFAAHEIFAEISRIGIVFVREVAEFQIQIRSEIVISRRFGNT